MKSICFIFFFILFGFVGDAQKRKDLKNDAEDSRDPKHEAFIEMNNGKILTYEVLKIKRPFMGFEYLEGDGKKLDISADSIRAFQTEKFYALRLFRSLSNGLGKIPFTELFGQRLRYGKIELYVISEMKRDAYGPSGSSSSSGYVKSYYLKKGSKGDAKLFSEKVLRSMIEDNKGLAEDFNKMFKRANAYKTITNIIDEYN